jgi:hypothetical protein
MMKRIIKEEKEEKEAGRLQGKDVVQLLLTV